MCRPSHGFIVNLIAGGSLRMADTFKGAKGVYAPRLLSAKVGKE